MNHLHAVVVGAVALAIVIWLIMPSSSAAKQDDENRIIDPSDARQIGLLIGMAGGTLADATVARFALERFEQIHGRKATTREMALVVGLMLGGDHTP